MLSFSFSFKNPITLYLGSACNTFASIDIHLFILAAVACVIFSVMYRSTTLETDGPILNVVLSPFGDLAISTVLTRNHRYKTTVHALRRSISQSLYEGTEIPEAAWQPEQRRVAIFNYGALHVFSTIVQGFPEVFMVPTNVCSARFGGDDTLQVLSSHHIEVMVFSSSGDLLVCIELTSPPHHIARTTAAWGIDSLVLWDREHVWMWALSGGRAGQLLSKFRASTILKRGSAGAHDRSLEICSAAPSINVQWFETLGFVLSDPFGGLWRYNTSAQCWSPLALIEHPNLRRLKENFEECPCFSHTTRPIVQILQNQGSWFRIAVCYSTGTADITITGDTLSEYSDPMLRSHENSGFRICGVRSGLLLQPSSDCVVFEDHHGIRVETRMLTDVLVFPKAPGVERYRFTASTTAETVIAWLDGKSAPAQVRTRKEKVP